MPTKENANGLYRPRLHEGMVMRLSLGLNLGNQLFFFAALFVTFFVILVITTAAMGL